MADPEDGGVVGVPGGLSSRFGDHRVRSTPISEQAIIGRIGARRRLMPIAEIMLMNFTAVAMDMIVNHAAKLRYMSGGQTTCRSTIRTHDGRRIGNGASTRIISRPGSRTRPDQSHRAVQSGGCYGLLRSCIDDPDVCHRKLEGGEDQGSSGSARRGQDRPRGRDSLRGRSRNREHAIRGAFRSTQETGDALRRRVFADAFLEPSGIGACTQCGAHSPGHSCASRRLML